ncbi:hypothetical protein CUROG_01945 [Corynebacterium urogenitale]|uniref:Secreted protein n=1 Tax=Corynebacterium urogenitale TaxID=2487892 RepID=A0A5J6Z926_9CORY|nr:hypothetical protein [Corynebacterium urogenitale]QFQ01789.1 hypothetical protein CUROG_01945 [Corynebacterium urogenitale]
MIPKKTWPTARSLAATRWRHASALLLVTVAAGGTLAACSDKGKSPVGRTQWQITNIVDNDDRGTILPDTQQGRSFVVIGRDSLTGASGCMGLSAEVSWGENDTQLTIDNFRAEEIDSNGTCIPGDEDTAERLGRVLDNHTLKISRPADNSLKLQQVIDDLPEWQTAPAVEFISGA